MVCAFFAHLHLKFVNKYLYLFAITLRFSTFVLTMTSEEWYQRGNDYSRKQDFQKALQCYMEAIALDPESPAVEAKEMLDNIYSFYCRDMYNP